MMQQMSHGENTKKGILDFLVAAVAALNYIHFNSTYVELATIGVKFYIPPVLFFILTIILVWAAINVTNCLMESMDYLEH